VAEKGGSSRPPYGTAVVTVGTFDGVHLGHRAVLGVLLREAEARRCRSVVVTFDPHPFRIVQPELAPRLLSSPEERLKLIEACGVDEIVILPFDSKVAAMSPRQFVEDILIARFGMVHLVLGHDHGMGRGRAGGSEALRELGEVLDFGVEVVPAVSIDGVPVSSSRIRAALDEGDAETAARGLGRPYVLRGRVVQGEGRGRRIGIPTANLEEIDPEKLVPLAGVYAVHAVLGQVRHPGVLHLGPRPTFQDAPPSIEVHILDFDEDLYGLEISIEFCGRLRGILAFGSVPELIEAIRGDIAAARRLFAGGQGACAGMALSLK